jgi:hypothetical protein
MTATLELAKEVPSSASAIGVAVASDRVGQEDLDWAFLRAQGFEGKLDQVAVIADGQGPDTIVVGVGESSGLDLAVLRRAAANLARAGRRRETIASRLLNAWPDDVDRAAAAQAFARVRRSRSTGSPATSPTTPATRSNGSSSLAPAARRSAARSSSGSPSPTGSQSRGSW